MARSSVYHLWVYQNGRNRMTELIQIEAKLAERRTLNAIIETMVRDADSATLMQFVRQKITSCAEADLFVDEIERRMQSAQSGTLTPELQDKGQDIAFKVEVINDGERKRIKREAFGEAIG
jgi:hypothetical protein